MGNIWFDWFCVIYRLIVVRTTMGSGLPTWFKRTFVGFLCVYVIMGVIFCFVSSFVSG